MVRKSVYLFVSILTVCVCAGEVAAGLEDGLVSHWKLDEGAGNTAYDSAVVNHDNPDAALVEEWTQWTIDLQEFAAQGVNLANVNTISIGFGDKNPDVSGQAGGSGMVFFDDIRLYRPAP